MIPELLESEMASVIGPVASGKTWLIKRWLTILKTPFAVFDPTGEYDDIPAEHFWAKPKAFAEYLSNNPKNFRAIYHPGENLEMGFTTVASAMWQLSNPRHLFVEEIHELISPWHKHDKMSIIMKYSRKRLLGVVGSTQRIADLHKDFTSGSRTVILFHTTEARDLEAIAERWGFETRSMVENLHPLIFDDVSGTTSQIPEAVVIRRGKPIVVERME
jgi:DNA helicase HerA-like ATPase